MTELQVGITGALLYWFMREVSRWQALLALTKSCTAVPPGPSNLSCIEVMATGTGRGGAVWQPLKVATRSVNVVRALESNMGESFGVLRIQIDAETIKL